MNSVLICDSRPEWMQIEDKYYACQTFCRKFQRCSTRVGFDCKCLGGNVIPKLHFNK